MSLLGARPRASSTNLLSAVDELVATLFREVLLAEEVLRAIGMLADALFLIVRSVFMFLRDTVQEIVLCSNASVGEFDEA